MGNSLLAVRGINHKYIVVERQMYQVTGMIYKESQGGIKSGRVERAMKSFIIESISLSNYRKFENNTALMLGQILCQWMKLT